MCCPIWLEEQKVEDVTRQKAILAFLPIPICTASNQMAETLVHRHIVDNTIKAKNQNGIAKIRHSPGPTKCTLILAPANTNLREKNFEPKTLELHEGTSVKIGRQTSSKTAPNPLNGFFDSKVLSRTHAEAWCDKGKVYIKDRKSSNGTFLNGERLSLENEESQEAELRDGDSLEFGIDITNDDGSVLYRKVACTVIVFASALSQVDGDILQKLHVDHLNGSSQSSTSSVISSDSSTSTISDAPPSPILSSKSSQNWDMVVRKLQNELQRSRKIETELRSARKAVLELDEERRKHMDSHTLLMQKQLREAQTRSSAYAEKCRHQEKALSAARRELQRLQTLEDSASSVLNRTRKQLEELRLTMDNQQLLLNSDLEVQRQKCIECEAKCLALEQYVQKLEQQQRETPNTQGTSCTRFGDILQMRTVQALLGLLMAIISALLYALIVL